MLAQHHLSAMSMMKPVAAANDIYHADDFCQHPTQLANAEGHEKSHDEKGFEQIVGNSPALKHVLEPANIVASSDSTVLPPGETSTGKELIARPIHDRSRRDRTFVKLNCAANSHRTLGKRIVWT